MGAVANNMPLEEGDLNPTDGAILDELHDGRCTPAFIAEKHGYSSGNVRNRMTHLASHGHVEGVGGGLYQLVDDPRDDVDDDRPDVDQLQNRIEELETENEELREQLEACQKENRELRERTDGGIDTRSVVADLESIQDQDDLERTIERYKEREQDD